MSFLAASTSSSSVTLLIRPRALHNDTGNVLVLVRLREYLERHIGYVHAAVILHQLRVFEVWVLQCLNNHVTAGLCAVPLSFPNNLATIYERIAFLVGCHAVAAVVVVDTVDFLLRKHLDFKLDNITVLVLETLRAGSGTTSASVLRIKYFKSFLAMMNFLLYNE